MRRTLQAIIFGTVIMLSACNPTLVTVKGKYTESATEIITNKPVDTAWSVISGIFTTNGLMLKSVDKNKGTVVTKKTQMSSIYTFEDKDGRLEQPQAWVVLPRVFNKEKEWKPKDIYGQWSIQVVESGKGVTTIKIDPGVYCTYFPSTFVKLANQGQSTGQLEALVGQALKNR